MLMEKRVHWSQEAIEEAKARAEMAAEVTLPIDQFKELLEIASKGE